MYTHMQNLILGAFAVAIGYDNCRDIAQTTIYVYMCLVICYINELL